jgi:ATP-dependent DNA helicase RecG
MSIVNTIQDLIDRGESPSVELISSADAHEQVARAVAAFLNTHRGTIVVGADQENADHEKLTKNEADKLAKYLRQKISPQHLFSVSLEDCPKGKLIVIDVPKGQDRPYVVDGAIYVRPSKFERWSRRILTSLAGSAELPPGCKLRTSMND